MSTKTLDFWLSVSSTQIQYNNTTTPSFSPYPFSFDSQKPNSVTHLELGFYLTRRKKNSTLNMMPAEPGALINYTRTQICTFCQSGGGFPTEKKGLGFPKPALKVQMKILFPPKLYFL